MAKRDWRETMATVYLCGSVDPQAEGRLHRVIYSYEVDGEHLSGEFFSKQPYKEGDRFTLRFDPVEPEVTELSLSHRKQVRWGRVGFAVYVVGMGFWMYHSLFRNGRWF